MIGAGAHAPAQCVEKLVFFNAKGRLPKILRNFRQPERECIFLHKRKRLFPRTGRSAMLCSGRQRRTGIRRIRPGWSRLPKAIARLLLKNAESDVHAVTSDFAGCPAILCQCSEPGRMPRLRRLYLFLLQVQRTSTIVEAAKARPAASLPPSQKAWRPAAVR